MPQRLLLRDSTASVNEFIQEKHDVFCDIIPQFMACRTMFPGDVSEGRRIGWEKQIHECGIHPVFSILHPPCAILASKAASAASRSSSVGCE